MSAKRTTNKKQRTKRSGRLVRPYPQLPLEKALQVAGAIKAVNGGNPLEPKQIADFCNIAPKSPTLVYLLSASSRFGLTSGSAQSEKVTLTDFGRQLIYAGTSDQEAALKKQAFLSVDIFRRVVEHYKGSQLPEMKYLGNTLQNEFGLVTELHEEFSNLFRENCKYVGITTVSASDLSQGNGKAAQENQASPHTVVLGEPKEKKGGTCFVIMPFSERSGKYAKGFFTEVLNSLIIPAATDAGFEVRTANRQGTEIIHATIVNEILNADLAICDLTEHNPNVLFELGMRLAHEKPVALIHAEGTERVFDVDNVLRVLSYNPNLWRTTLEKDLPNLKSHIQATWEGRSGNETYLSILKKTPSGGKVPTK